MQIETKHILDKLNYQGIKVGKNAEGIIEAVIKEIKVSRNEEFFAPFSEVEDIEVWAGKEHLLMKGSPNFIRVQTPGIKYQVNYKNGRRIQWEQNKCREFIGEDWYDLN